MFDRVRQLGKSLVNRAAALGLARAVTNDGPIQGRKADRVVADERPTLAQAVDAEVLQKALAEERLAVMQRSRQSGKDRIMALYAKAYTQVARKKATERHDAAFDGSLRGLWPMLGDDGSRSGPRRNPHFTKSGPGRYHPKAASR